MGATADKYWVAFWGGENILKLWWWVHNSVNLLKYIELYTWHGWIVWCVNHVPLKLWSTHRLGVGVGVQCGRPWMPWRGIWTLLLSMGSHQYFQGAGSRDQMFVLEKACSSGMCDGWKPGKPDIERAMRICQICREFGIMFLVFCSHGLLPSISRR